MTVEEDIGAFLIHYGMKISTAESCTGGLLSSKLTDISGSSAYITLNLVTYANGTKHKLLGVDEEILNTKGAVSEECAFQMAKGLYELTKSDICVSTTGIAGPTGGTKEKPVGLMFTAVKYNGIATVKEVRLSPDLPRIEMKQKFSDEALKLALSVLKDNRIA